MKSINYTLALSSFLVASTVVGNAAISINGTNYVDYDATTSAIVDNAGNVIADGSGFVAIGSFGSMSIADIQALTDGTAMASAFDELSSGTMGAAGFDGVWSASFEDAGDTSSLAGQPIYTVIGNGSDLSLSDQFFVYYHGDVNGTGLFLEDPGNNTDAVVAEGAASTGSVVIGEHGNFNYDFGAGNNAAYNLVTIPVPEPTSTALLGLGAFAFVLRRRR
ncbi:PEP-CTERM sorting domain-containing protein [Verrucomicrobiaceae bacterium N1E253]|uniref:PEP-CTERM sorting domain-containing protein n=1 Tax=Oceaniferula marina TaxID=2748318 RepID=A0A851GJK1_9BACT|nr:PEP-CTERM sorting domain-containing protein [Oceaniferula marina]NWK57349.1 PEP-CTERM sorting domain-containing protein [Oceaniferula marina]